MKRLIAVAALALSAAACASDDPYYDSGPDEELEEKATYDYVGEVGDTNNDVYVLEVKLLDGRTVQCVMNWDSNASSDVECDFENADE